MQKALCQNLKGKLYDVKQWKSSSSLLGRFWECRTFQLAWGLDRPDLFMREASLITAGLHN
jgi:hypothetical protein